MLSAEPAVLLDATTRRYLTSGDFNGLPTRTIQSDDATKRAVLRTLAGKGVLSFGLPRLQSVERG